MVQIPKIDFSNEFAAIAATTHFIVFFPDLIYGSSSSHRFHINSRSVLKVNKPVQIADQLTKKWASQLFTASMRHGSKHRAF